MTSSREIWPPLPFAAWEDTYATLHMYFQIVGKIRLAQMQMMNQWWQVPLYVSLRGLTTRPMPHGDRLFEIEFDLQAHMLLIRTEDGLERALPLGGSVQAFYRDVMTLLDEMKLPVSIWTTPVEVPHPIPFERDDVHARYDHDAVERCWRILLHATDALERFRTRFRGKCSPVHFFWGSFDLAVTRFSGRFAPPRPGADRVTRLAYDEDVSSVGFWPGGVGPTGARLEEPAFYAYHAPVPEGFARQRVSPSEAYFHEGLGEFILPYEAVRKSPDPTQAILEFAESTYRAGARLAGWPLEELAYLAARLGPIAFIEERLDTPALPEQLRGPS